MSNSCHSISVFFSIAFSIFRTPFSGSSVIMILVKLSLSWSWKFLEKIEKLKLICWSSSEIISKLSTEGGTLKELRMISICEELVDHSLPSKAYQLNLIDPT